MDIPKSKTSMLAEELWKLKFMNLKVGVLLTY